MAAFSETHLTAPEQLNGIRLYETLPESHKLARLKFFTQTYLHALAATCYIAVVAFDRYGNDDSKRRSLGGASGRFDRFKEVAFVFAPD